MNTIISSTSPDLVVNLGDTFDTHAVVRSEVLSEFIRHVKFVGSLKIPYVYVLGNHDMYKPTDSKYHALLPFKGTIENFHIIDEVVDLFGMTFVPYQAKPENFPTRTLPLCVAHQTFQGADYGDVTTREGVMAEGVAGCEYIVSGHIHKHQILGGGRTTVCYPGSPFSQSANDVNQVKGLILFDTETYKYEFIRCPLPMWHKLTAEVERPEDLQNFHSILESQINSEDHWLIDLTGPKAEIQGYLKSKPLRDVISGIDVKIKTHYTDKDKRAVKIEAHSMEHIISEYVVKVYSGSIDKSTLEQKALEVLSTVRTTK